VAVVTVGHGQAGAHVRGEVEGGDAGTERKGGEGASGSVDPQKVWELLQRGDARLLDLRTEIERRRYGAPPGAIPVSLARHVRKPEGEAAIYLCQHAVRSKATLRNGAAEVAGGFVAWRRAGLPIETVQ
jgi:rhodanese-related sulfurtransferase